MNSTIVILFDIYIDFLNFLTGPFQIYYKLIMPYNKFIIKYEHIDRHIF